MVSKVFSGYIKITERDIKDSQSQIKLKSIEDIQIPRWQMAKMYAEMDDPSQLSDSPKARGELIKQARDAHKKRMARLDKQEQARTTGLEWKKRQNPFTEDELDKILPTRRPGRLLLTRLKTLLTFLLVTLCSLIAILGVLFGIVVLMHGLEYFDDLKTYLHNPIEFLTTIKQGFIDYNQELIDKPL